ncbi:MAG: HD domain-containing protein [Ferruginibacter sp.]
MQLNQTIEPDFKKAEAFILDSLKNELSSDLHYHGVHHTIDVMDAAMKIAAFEKLPAANTAILRIAVAFHDAGFIYTYQGHEEKGCEMAREFLPAFGFNKNQIDLICSMIMATKIPQNAKTILEKIICDADLDYLGRDDVQDIAQTLYEELKLHSKVKDERSWDETQIHFLRNHHYHTAYSAKYRSGNKHAYLEALVKKWE